MTSPITPMLLMAAGATAANAMLYAPYLAAACLRRGITAPADVANFLAEVMNESGNLACVHEGMSYSTAARIAAVFPGHFPGGARQALAYVCQPVLLGNLVYASLGGYDDRGDSLGQITGLANFRLYAADVGKPEAEIEAYMATPEGAADAPAWYFVHFGCRGLGNPMLVRDKWAGAPAGAHPIGLPNVLRLYGILAPRLGVAGHGAVIASAQGAAGAAAAPTARAPAAHPTSPAFTTDDLNAAQLAADRGD